MNPKVDIMLPTPRMGSGIELEFATRKSIPDLIQMVSVVVIFRWGRGLL